RLAWDLVSTASVTTTASVVFSTAVAAGPPLRRDASLSGVEDAGNTRPPNSSFVSNGAAQNQGPSPTVTLPTALTTASAATLIPDEGIADADPRLHIKLTVCA